MMIRDMFFDDINRKVNGVIKVDQDETAVVSQEVREYVITKELKKHFITFFNYYGDAFTAPTADMGVWISGFFGSGKSHFLKMLSYILENREIDGVKTVERFREKFSDDPATFMLIDKATKYKTETILFNIDIEGSINKDKTAVLRVFAKMFYNHLGFYGENLKVAMLEKYIDQNGKTEEFRRVFEEKKGKPWVEQRKAFAFNGKFVVPTLMEVLGMSEKDAQNWFNDKTAVDFSIAQLVGDIKDYVSSKPENFRLLFMVDEAGQYVGTDTDMLLNLQSLTEKIGSECGSSVWVVCTGQEAIDEIIKVRADEFSRIQARFKTRLSLTSSSVDEVIQKRILKKKPSVTPKLEALYNENDSVLRNLFSFTDSILDIKGFGGPQEFVVDFPFVPYQFIIMQKVFSEIRKHGSVGKHFSGGERSMLSGFQEAAQKVQEHDEYTLVPFFRFYDTVHGFLDGSIRRVIERCQRAAESGAGIEPYDVNVLKLLYLIRYVDDIKSTLDNIVILMADDIRTDKITLREAVRNSLDRLLSQNYIARSGDVYNFLTDEEQDIQREIRNTPVDTAAIVERIGQLIYGEIYTAKRFRYGKNDFPFDQMVDGVTFGAATGGMKLRFLTVATDAAEKSEMYLMTLSQNQAVVVLADTPYYESLESAMKIRKYVKQRNVNQLPKSVQDIIRDQQDEANAYDETAKEALRKAIESGDYYVKGEHLPFKGGDAKFKIDQALEYLVGHVYTHLELITKNYDSDNDIVQILSGHIEQDINGQPVNQSAAALVEEYLEIQGSKNLPTSMADIQSRYQISPYGWREIDIAATVAMLIFNQKITVKYAGTTIQPNNPKLPDMLRKKSEIGKTIVSQRKSVTAVNLRKAKEFLRDYLDIFSVPDDEDGMIAFILTQFNGRKTHYEDLLSRYNGKHYPDKALVSNAVSLMNDVLSQRKDNVALVNALLKKQDELEDSKDDLQNVEAFFQSQVQIFDAAAKMLSDLQNELDYFTAEPEADAALNRIRLLVSGQGKFDYRCIPELNTLMATVRAGHSRLLDGKRRDVHEILCDCRRAVLQAANDDVRVNASVTKADRYYADKEQSIKELNSLALLDALVPQMLHYKDTTCKIIDATLKPAVQNPQPSASVTKKTIKAYNRQILFPAKRLESDADVDAYVDMISKQLKMLLKNADGIEIK